MLYYTKTKGDFRCPKGKNSIDTDVRRFVDRLFGRCIFDDLFYPAVAGL